MILLDEKYTAGLPGARPVNILLWFMTLLTAPVAYSQNLIPNPSFEVANYCEANIPCSPAGWYSVSNYPYGYQHTAIHPFDGKHALSMIVAVQRKVRIYWQTKLLCPLTAGQPYTFTFYVNPTQSAFNPAWLGIRFPDTLYHTRRDTLLLITETSDSSNSMVQKQKRGWYKTTIPFTATGKEKFLLIGNFSPVPNQQILEQAGKGVKYIEYYIDQLMLEPAGQTVQQCTGYQARLDALLNARERHVFPAEKTEEVVYRKESMPVAPPRNDTLLLGSINFAVNSDKLTSPAIIENYFGQTSISNINAIKVIGYTDSTGTVTHNLALSEKRALSVKKFLSDAIKIPAGIIITEGRGITHDQPGLSGNRRVEIIIYRKEPG